MNTNATQPTEIDKRLEEIVAELYAPTAEGRRYIAIAAALLRARKRLSETQAYMWGDTDRREQKHKTDLALADPELEELLR